MKKSDALIKVVSALVFCAMLAYISVYLVRSFVNPVRTALTVTATMTDSSAMSGLVVRDELLLKSNQDYINVIVSDGEKVAANQTVAVTYATQEALERASALSSLEKEIEDVKETLSSVGSVSATGSRDKSVFNALIGLSATVRGGNLVAAETQESALANLVFRTQTTDATEEYLQQLQASYEELSAQAAEDTTEITVGESGFFSTVIDGYEGVNPAYVEELTPSGLRELISADRVVDQTALGKLISSYHWYYAAIMDEEDAKNLIAGNSVQLSFGRYYSDYLDADVEYVGRAENHEQLVVFRMEKGFDSMLAVRAVSAEVIYSEYAGLRLPIAGLYRYYAGYLAEEDAALLSEGGSVSLSLGGTDYSVRVSEVGSAYAYGELPTGVEAGSEEDTRPKRCLVVFFWPWEDIAAPDSSAGNGTVTLADGLTKLYVENYYEYDPEADLLCVFTKTGMQAERKKVSLIYAGEEYCLVSSQGTDALREGNEVIVSANNLHNGMVFR